jgi:hypothetical protein
LLALGFVFLLISRAFLGISKKSGNNYWLRVITLILVIGAGILGILSAGKTISYFTNNQTVENNIPLDTAQHHFILKSFGERNYHWGRSYRWHEDTLTMGNVELLIETTEGAAQLIEYRSAYGQNLEMARLNAAGINSNISVHDSIIQIPNLFSFNSSQPFRGQDLRYTLKLPVGSTFTMDENFNNHIRCYTGTENDYDELDNGNTYIVTKNGIRCTDCNSSRSYGSINAAGYHYDYTEHDVNINKIHVSSAMKIKIIKGNTLMVKARNIDNRSDLVISYHGNTLGIKQRKHWGITLDDIHPEVLVVLPELSAVTLEGAVEAEVLDFEQDEFGIYVSGAVKCRAELAVNTLNIEQSGATILHLNGNAKNCKVEMSGASKLNALAMEMEKLNIELDGACGADVNVTKNLDAEASGAGSVRFKGNPAKVNQNSSGAGKVIAIE